MTAHRCCRCWQMQWAQVAVAAAAEEAVAVVEAYE
jgi:hypothetical protein